MGLYDRDYNRADFQSRFRNAPQMRMGFPRLTPMVKWLLIINGVVFLVQILGGNNLLLKLFALYSGPFIVVVQLWRLITYQFLHSVDGIWHILGNMLGLYFFGLMLERQWGSKKFLRFYLICGVTGGVVYPLLVHTGYLRPGFLIGASGAIFGILAAAAILFPRRMVYVMGIFPIPMAILALAYLVGSYMGLRSGKNAGAEVVHLAGMAAGATYVLFQPWRAKFKLKIHSGRWEKKISARRNLQLELDRILQKVHESGIHSLTSKEKKTLKQATEAEQMRKGPNPNKL